jgi:hypothetical protein
MSIQPNSARGDQLACAGPIALVCREAARQALTWALRPAAKFVADSAAKKMGLKVLRGLRMPGGGRSGQNVKNLIGPPNSVVGKPGGNGLWYTNANGQVVKDLTFEGTPRVKEVIPGQGFKPAKDCLASKIGRYGEAFREINYVRYD